MDLKPVLAGMGRILALSVSLFANLDAAVAPADALGACGSTERPLIGQGCKPCEGITTPASVTSAQLTQIFAFSGIQKTKYAIVNDVGAFDITGTNLQQFSFTVPPPAPASIPRIDGTLPVVLHIHYSAFPHIPDLTLTWGAWVAGEHDVRVDAQLSGHIDVHVSADPIVVNPRLTLTNLPVTISFGADPAGRAAVTPDKVVVAPVGPHGSVDNCGAFDWCDGLIRKILDDQVQKQLQSQISHQLNRALNDSGPFWSVLMNKLANASPIPLLTDPAGHFLPSVNVMTPGGVTHSYTIQDNRFSFAGGELTTIFASSQGLCYFDCTPTITAAQVCQAHSCGTRDDGCGDTISCSGTCAGDHICSNNVCTACRRLTCADVTVTCGPIADGCGGTLECLVCQAGRTCRDQVCVGFGGPDGLFCKQCVANGGRCTAGPGGTNDCIIQ